MLAQDQIRFIVSLIVSVPLSFILQKIAIVKVRHIYSFLLGTLLQIYVYGIDIWMVFLLHCIVYMIIKIRPKKCGKIVTLTSLLGLSIYHIYRMIISYGSWKLDLSTVIMAIVCKYSLFAYAVEDGRRDKLSKQQQQNKVVEIPSFLHFISYCQFLPTAIMGTAIEFNHFNNYMNQLNQYRNITSPWKDVFFDMGYGLLLAGLYFFNIFFFSLSQMQSQQFPEKGFIYVLIFGFFSVTTLRMKYYFAWKFSQGSVHASGVSFNINPDGTQDFKGVQTCNPEKVQSTKHIRVKISNWNMSCQQWLRKSIYERSSFKNRTFRQMYTFMISCYWHGFYGGYYITFFLWFCHLHCSGLIFSETKKKSSIYVKGYKMTGFMGRCLLWIYSNVVFTVNGIYFQVLEFEQSLKILSALHYIPPLFIILPTIYFTFFGTREKKIKATEDKKQNESSTQANQSSASEAHNKTD